MNQQMEYAAIGDALQKCMDASPFTVETFCDLLTELVQLKRNEMSVEETFKKLRPAKAQLEKYWKRVKTLYEVGDKELACFCSVTLLEECAKVLMLFYSGFSPKLGKKFRSHDYKHLLPAVYLLAASPRLYKTYGSYKLCFELLCSPEKSELMAIRNNCLYMDYKNNELLTPDDLLHIGEVNLVICLCAEAYAETLEHLGDEGDDFERVLQEIEKFKSKHKIGLDNIKISTIS